MMVDCCVYNISVEFSKVVQTQHYFLTVAETLAKGQCTTPRQSPTNRTAGARLIQTLSCHVVHVIVETSRRTCFLSRAAPEPNRRQAPVARLLGTRKSGLVLEYADLSIGPFPHDVR